MSSRRDTPFSLVFSREEILAKLRENRERYVDTYATVKVAFRVKYDNYRTAHSQWTEKILSPSYMDEDDDTEPIAPRLPADKTELYDLYIAMLDKAVDSDYSEFELTVDLFAKLWMDRWDFVREHIRTMTLWSSELRAGGTTTSTSSSTDLSAALVAYGVE